MKKIQSERRNSQNDSKIKLKKSTPKMGQDKDMGRTGEWV